MVSVTYRMWQGKYRILLQVVVNIVSAVTRHGLRERVLSSLRVFLGMFTGLCGNMHEVVQSDLREKVLQHSAWVQCRKPVRRKPFSAATNRASDTT